MTMVRVQSASISSRIWVEITIALSPASSFSRPRTSCFWFGSRPSVGSSRIRTSGSWRIAWAMPTRRLKPLDRVSIGRWATSSSIRLAIAFSIRRALSGPAKPRTRATKSSSSAGVMSP